MKQLRTVVMAAFLVLALCGCDTLSGDRDVTGPSSPEIDAEDASAYYTPGQPLVALWWVDHIKQVPPGDWNNTKNCGQAAVLTVANWYLNNWYTWHRPNEIPWQIENENNWLADYSGDRRFRDPNGYTATVDQLVALAEGYWGFNARTDTTTLPALIAVLRWELSRGQPVIVLVRVGMTTYKVRHYMVVMAIDENNKGIWVNDPGRTGGKHNWYSMEQFEASWNSAGNHFIIINQPSGFCPLPW